MVKKYLQLLNEHYPSTQQLGDISNSIQNLVTDQIVRLPTQVLTRAQKAISEIYQTAHSSSYISDLQKSLGPDDNELLKISAQPSSVLMAYDFHYDIQTNRLALIEINTNASAFMLSDLLYKLEGSSPAPWPNSLDHLLASFKSETAHFGNSLSSVALIDESPNQQRMYVEFLMYQDFFRKNKIQCEICDVKSFEGDFDLIYNRYTDFTFVRTESAKLRRDFLASKTVFSPHPSEYLRLADKAAQILLAKHADTDVFLETLLFENVTDWNALWEKRKKYIFKPQRSHGAKAVYRGDSISRKKFEEIRNEKFLAQEYCAPGLIGDFKFDLRFFVYKDAIQLGVARIFQGQVLNFGNPGGGLARVYF